MYNSTRRRHLRLAFACMIFHEGEKATGGGASESESATEGTEEIMGLFDRDMLRSEMLNSTQVKPAAAEAEEEKTPEEEPEPEPEEEEQEQEQEKGEEQEEEAETLPAEAVKIRDSMQKRIDTLTAQLTEAKAAKPAAPLNQPQALDDIESESDLASAISAARSAKDWALQNLDGGEIPSGEEGKPGKFLDSKAVGRILANAERVLDAAPQRREALAAIAQGEAASRQLYPDAYRAGTPGAQFRETMLKQVPPSVQKALRSWRGDWETIIFDASLVGTLRQNAPADWADRLTALLAASKPASGATTPKSGVKSSAGKTPVPPGSKSPPPTPGGRQAPKVPEKQLAQRRTQEALRKGKGSERALTAAVLARFA